MYRDCSVFVFYVFIIFCVFVVLGFFLFVDKRVLYMIHAELVKNRKQFFFFF